MVNTCATAESMAESLIMKSRSFINAQAMAKWQSGAEWKTKTYNKPLWPLKLDVVKRRIATQA